MNDHINKEKVGGPILCETAFDEEMEAGSGASNMIAFWDGYSRGTLDAMRRAVAHGLTVIVVYTDGTANYWHGEKASDGF